jgi:ribonuclease BN (tRNA processing enzyme)
MRPLFHPSLVNGRYGDPTVYVETLFETHSVLFDLGEIASLSPRRIQRIDQIFVSHAHIDHFVGFDHLLRSLVGRKKTVHLYGPVGFAERVYHKLQAYRWNLVESYRSDLVFVVSELETSGRNSFASKRSRFPKQHKRLSAMSTCNGTGLKMTDSPTEAQKYAAIEDALQKLAAEGLIYDTGQRKWSERTKSYQIVWEVVPPKHKRS